MTIATTQHVAAAMRRGWWKCAEELIRLVSAAGKGDVDSIFQLEQRAITRQLSGLRSALESSKPVQVISPALEWAQSGDEVFLNVKFSHKLDAPATLDVAVPAEAIDIQPLSLRLDASKDRKRFVLELDLWEEVDPTASAWSLGSVGRVTITLRKKAGRTKWPRLLGDAGKKLQNQHTWWSKQEQFTDELEDVEEEAAALKRKTKKEAAEAAAAASSVEAKFEADESAVAGSAVAFNDEGSEISADALSVEEDAAATAAAVAAAEAVTALEKAVADARTAVERERKAAIKQLDKEARRRKKEVDEAAEAQKKEIDADVETQR
ncbi:unnamed protein product, partial [Phaeothamnion confervicola]